MKTGYSKVECIFHPVLTGFLFVVDKMYRKQWRQELVITSGSETTAKHSRTSLHYATPCQAADTRIWETGRIPKPEKQQKAIRLEADLYCYSLDIPCDWIEVILESNHMHIEYQPKRPEELN